MHVVGHALSAVPFLLLGMPGAALGAIAPDITWVCNELRYRASFVRPWTKWIETLDPRMIVPYRIAHSLFMPMAFAFLWPDFALGYAMHLALDLPTHTGVMRQQPFYPIAWRWPWTFR